MTPGRAAVAKRKKKLGSTQPAAGDTAPPPIEQLRARIDGVDARIHGLLN